jgi:hypothetical protein
MPSPERAVEIPIEELPFEERIRRYELYAQRGNQSCSQIDDWFHCRKELVNTREPP